MSLEKLKELLESDEYFGVDEIEGVEIIESGEWTQDHKYQYKDTIFKYEDIFYCLSSMRQGSYHTDWYDCGSTLYTVERKEETKVVVTWPTTSKGVEIKGEY